MYHFTKYAKYALLLLLVCLPLFGHLDTLCLRIWDEARVANNALEMYKNHKWLVPYYNGNPDLWNTKPPLLIWMQVLCMKMIGPGELAIRLPSAVSAFLLCAALLLFLKNYVKDFWFAFIVILVLITSEGFVTFHAARSGDYDVPLALFSSLYCIFFFCYAETDKSKYIYLTFACITLAVLTKGVAGILLLPGISIYLFTDKVMTLRFLKNYRVYICTAISLITISLYYFIRELKNPGYLHAVAQNELGGRYLSSLEANKGDVWYYFDYIVNQHFAAWYIFIPMGIAVSCFSKNNRIKKLVLFCSILTVTYLIIISLAGTKLRWYDIPMLPFLAIIAGSFIYFIFDLIGKSETINRNLRKNLLPYAFLLYIFVNPYHRIINDTFELNEKKWGNELYSMSYYLKEASNGKHNPDGCSILENGYNPQDLFYARILEDRGQKIGFKNYKELKTGDKVLVYTEEVKAYIIKNYRTGTPDIYNNISCYEIK